MLRKPTTPLISLSVIFAQQVSVSPSDGKPGRTLASAIPANRSFKRLLICSLNDSPYNAIILFPVQLIEYTDWGCGRGGGGLAMGEELMPLWWGP